MENQDRQIVESRSFPLPELLSRVADGATVARQRLLDWGVGVPDGDRISQAVALLREAARTGHIQPADDGVAPVLRAAWVAADFIDIAAFLPQDRVKAVRQELTVASTGELWPPQGLRRALQFQSQHWIAAILLHAGLNVEYACFSSNRQIKLPEFFVHRDDDRIAVEVKRPESARRIGPSVVEANAKFADHKDSWGAIILELTDCVLPAREEEFQQHAETLRAIAHGAIWDAQHGTYKPGFERIIYLGVVYRGAWAVGGPSGTRLRLIGIALHTGYCGEPKSRQEEASTWFQVEVNCAYNGVITRLGR
jgi:hypothetical protein